MVASLHDCIDAESSRTNIMCEVLVPARFGLNASTRVDLAAIELFILGCIIVYVLIGIEGKIELFVVPIDPGSVVVVMYVKFASF